MIKHLFQHGLEMFLRFSDRYLERRQLLAVMVSSALVVGVAVIAITSRGARADQVLVSGKASIFYCTAGDTADDCDPTSSRFSGTGLSNQADTVAIVEDKSPTAPANLTSSLAGPAGFTLTWEASTDDIAISAYVLDVATDNQFASPVTAYASKSLGNVTTLALSGLQSETTYYARVRARDTGNNVSDFSNTVTITTTAAPDTQAPSVPTALTVANSAIDAVAVSWNAATDAAGVVGYRIDVSPNNRFTELLTGRNKQDVGNATSVTINQLQEATTYYVRVYAYDAANNMSAPSDPVAVTTQQKPDTTAPTKPANLKASYQGASSNIKVEWSSASDDRGVVRYTLDVATDAQFKETLGGFQAKDVGLAVQTNIQNVDTAKTYYFRVSAYDAANNMSESTTSLAAKPAEQPVPTAPAPPVANNGQGSGQNNGSAPSQPSTPVVTGPYVTSVCFGFRLEQPGKSKNVMLTAYDPDGRKVAKIRLQHTGTEMVVTDPRFVGSLTDKDYTFVIKADDHLAAKVVANPRQPCLATNRKLYFGDIEGTTQDEGEAVAGDNVIEPKDIVTVIRRRLRNELPASAVVDVIRNRIRHAKGE